MSKPEKKQVNDIAEVLRDMKNWVFVFAKQHELSEEATDILHKKIDEVADKLGKLTCK